MIVYAIPARRVELWLARQAVLDRQPDPLELSVVMPWYVLEVEGGSTDRELFDSTAQANCVELAETPNGILMRDSKHPGDGALTFTRAELAAFIAACRAGELDQLL
jgi:hypothetical protein